MGFNINTIWFVLFNICFLLFTLSEARHGQKFISTLLVGTVHCDTCSEQVSSTISGASVAVKCRDGSLKNIFYQQVKTDENGEFQVHLPTRASKDLQSIKGCSIKLVHSGDSSCDVASSASPSAFIFKATKEGTHIFSAGVFTFKPMKQPEYCDKKPYFITPPYSIPTPIPYIPGPPPLSTKKTPSP